MGHEKLDPEKDKRLDQQDVVARRFGHIVQTMELFIRVRIPLCYY
jgi:hypothetical protein